MNKLIKTIGVISFCAFFGYLIIDPTGEVKIERIENQNVEKAIKEARAIERLEFCKRYREIVPNIKNAPYAYKDCYQ